MAGASARRGHVRSLRDLELRGRRVFLRADLDMPLDRGRISDRTRIEATLPSLRFVLQRSGRLLIASHLGRPDGERRPELSLRPVAKDLAEALGVPAELAPDCIGETTERLVNALGPGQALVLENLRFHPEEEKNEAGFALKLARLGDVYVND
ncbi:MAG: phosphoglycerate kinase, partial [Deltaproteobacteria bacterium]